MVQGLHPNINYDNDNKINLQTITQNRKKLTNMLKEVMQDQIIKIRVLDDFKKIYKLGLKWQAAKDKCITY